MRYRTALLAALAATLTVCWVLTRPLPAGTNVLDRRAGDPAAGKAVFDAGGCAGCHAEPGAEGAARLVLAGGRRLASPYGIFVAPNISPDPEHGIGGWSARDLLRAMRDGVSPDGRHYYPAFPYTSYRHASARDIADLKAYLDTLPAAATPNTPHEIRFPYSLRPMLGLWKRLHLRADWVVPENGLDETTRRGRYLVEALGHCGACHTPRGPLGGLDRENWLAGAPDPDGEGRIPNITPGALDWSAEDIAYYLKTGFTPEYDSAGGEMVEVIAALSRLADADRAAIAAYLKAVPGRP
ncbi:diacylglycerol kinase [Maritimibacter sp. 55A14]|uniref:c-type cytochrome n=1 Tax=Maritimibacter sp. 55A14 TaxID=2174844 RepID=UPI000D621A47|nr:cytochrome c [Maritimibacter sp. 55A14]PWE33137.1 diacylglycerol kinase [Maritimibacter sp. 55A14]